MVDGSARELVKAAYLSAHEAMAGAAILVKMANSGSESDRFFHDDAELSFAEVYEDARTALAATEIQLVGETLSLLRAANPYPAEIDRWIEGCYAEVALSLAREVLPRVLSATSPEQHSSWSLNCLTNFRDKDFDRSIPPLTNDQARERRQQIADEVSDLAIPAEALGKHLWKEAIRATGHQDLTEAEIRAENVPAQYREGGKPDGELLTAKYVGQPHTYGISAATLSRKLSGHRIKVGHSFIYEFEKVAASSASKSLTSQ